MILGLSFGKKKTSSDSTSTINKNEATTQNTQGTRATSGTTTQTGTQNTQGSSLGQQSSTQSGRNTSVGSTTGTTTQTTRAFSDPVLSGIERVVGDLFNSVGGREPISNFNSDEFVRSGVASAQADIGAGLESNVNQLFSNVGGTGNSNSMAALLSNRLRGDAAAELAGVRSSLIGQSETINRDNQLAGNAIAATDQGFLANLLQSLKGGVTTATGVESTTTAQDQLSTQVGNVLTAEQNTSNTASTNTQTQELLEVLNQLLTGSVNTTGTETNKGRVKEVGGGASVSI